MIVFTGDWVKLKYNKQWKQVVAINFNDDTFSTLDVDGEPEWWDTEDLTVFLDHISNTQYCQSFLFTRHKRATHWIT